ncbi:exopolyphosphatase [Solicola sp. PLA-1-18]|uniref:Ppx/GppA phosphatase family protein n=1 Tax=Solicola sp. PLA-1-18 TaxID=3380532 RepID=UPI003B80E643
MTRVAAIDCGTNSIRLLVADVRGDRKDDLVRDMRIVRLGQGVDRTGRLDPEALRRTLEACREYAGTIADLGAERIRLCATSATRDASNAADFAAGVREVLGVEPEVLSGDDEAALTYLGASRDLPDVDEPVLVADLGGGSTELVVGTGGTADQAVSLDVGSVRLTERHLADDPPTAEQVEACRADVHAALDASGIDLTSVRTVVGVAGTITTVAAGVLGLDGYDRDRIHHASLPFADVRTLCDDLVSSSVARRRELAWLHPGRADVIGGGALVLGGLLDAVPSATQQLLVSESDILDGIAWTCA